MSVIEGYTTICSPVGELCHAAYSSRVPTPDEYAVLEQLYKSKGAILQPEDIPPELVARLSIIKCRSRGE